MRCTGLPQGMWLRFKKSFEQNMVSVLGFGRSEATKIIARAKPQYREIITALPEFEKGDRFKMNLVNCALFSALLLNMDKKPTLDCGDLPQPNTLF